MTVLEAIDIVAHTKCKIVDGDKDEFEEAVFTLGLNACKHAEFTAEWVYVCDTPFFENVYECSHCGRQAGSRTLTTYCGDCGRKMRMK